MKAKLFLLIFCILFLSLDKYVSSPELLPRDSIDRPSTHILGVGQGEAALAYSYWKTTHHYDDKGFRKNLQGRESYNKDEFEIGGAYTWWKPLQLNSKLRYRLVNSRTIEGKKEDNQGLESILAGGKFYLGKLQEWEFAFYSSYRYPLYRNEYLKGVYYETNSVALGDREREWINGLSLGAFILSDLYLTSDFEFHRYDSLSDELALRFSGHFYQMDEYKMSLNLGLEMVSSLGNGSSQLEKRASTRLGSTNLFNSANRNYYSPFGELHYAFNKDYKIQIGGSLRREGSSTDGGHEFWSVFTARFNPKSERIVSPESVAKGKGKIITAKVIRYSPQKMYMKIDQGVKQGFSPGMRLDIYEENLVFDKKFLGIGRVIEVDSFDSIVKIEKLFSVNISDEALKNIKVQGYYW